MNNINVIKYPVVHPLLKNYIKYFWILNTNNNVHIHNKLLPVSNMDLILNLSSPIKYVKNNGLEVRADKYHFNGIHTQHYCIDQIGQLNVIGVSFTHYGFYSFLKVPIFEFMNKTIALNDVLPKFQLENMIDFSSPIAQIIDALEKCFLKAIDFEIISPSLIGLFNEFYYNDENYKIKDFCNYNGMEQKQMERLFQKHIGTTPKMLQKLIKFQKATNLLINGEKKPFTMISNELEYYDQAHFNKDFRFFAGCCPSEFIVRNSTVKELLYNNNL